MYGEFQKLETVILGISPDSETSHQNFISKYDVPFNLLCDPQKKVMEAYGAFGEKKMDGKVTRGVIRSTVWVGPDGKVKRHWRQVTNAADHPAKVLEALKSIPN
jgi:peroxiredoxin Q/BCP